MPMTATMPNSAMRTVPASTIGEIGLAAGTARSRARGHGCRSLQNSLHICPGGEPAAARPDQARKLLGNDRQERLIAASKIALTGARRQRLGVSPQHPLDHAVDREVGGDALAQ